MAYEIQTNCPIVMLKVNIRENSFNVFSNKLPSQISLGSYSQNTFFYTTFNEQKLVVSLMIFSFYVKVRK